MTRHRATLISATGAVLVGFVLAPLISHGLGLRPFGIGTLIGPGIVFFILRRILQSPWPDAAPRFDISAARRESHALGLPFPESDGTLSLPPDQDLRVPHTGSTVKA